METYFKKLRIVIISSDSGGSKIAAHIVRDAMMNKFTDAECFLIFIDDLFLGRVIFGIDWYLLLARLECYGLIRSLLYLGKRIFGLMEKYFKIGLRRKLFEKRQEPDLIISLIPFVNPPLLHLAKKKNIPVFVLSTDMDSELYSYKWPEGPDLPPYRLGLFCDHKDVLAQLNSSVDLSKLVFTGGFVREEFTRIYSDEEKRGFRRSLALPQDREIISIMMGSLGGKQLGDYVLRILDGIDNEEFRGEPHFVIFCAKNGSLKRKLERIVNNRGYLKNKKGYFQRPFGKMSFSILGFVDQVHQYFLLSAGLITKPGGGSINEALALNLPLIIDKVHGQLPWEQLSSMVLCDQGLGVVIEDLRLLPHMIHDYFLDKEEGAAMRARQHDFHSKYPSPHSFSEVIGNTVESLLLEQ